MELAQIMVDEHLNNGRDPTLRNTKVVSVERPDENKMAYNIKLCSGRKITVMGKLATDLIEAEDDKKEER